MKTRIALLRGINVGGSNLLPMRDLSTLLEDLGAGGVRTYIQSGNAIFHSTDEDGTRFGQRLAAEIRARFGFEPFVLVLEPEYLVRAIAENPFPDAINDPSKLHLGFLAARPDNPDHAKLAELRAGKERFHLGDRVFYLHLPDGAGRSKLAAGAEKSLGVPMTVRNWKTACKLMAMADALRR
jgi:uncharacterized protein (DUF1697 family)